MLHFLNQAPEVLFTFFEIVNKPVVNFGQFIISGSVHELIQSSLALGIIFYVLSLLKGERLFV